MHVVLKGILFGLILTVTVGPVFFKLIQTSIRKGFLFGLFMAIGISLADSIYAFAAYFGLAQFADQSSFKFYMALVGGIILIGYGISTLFKAVHPPVPDNEQDHKTLITEIFTGLIINGLNPFVLLFWIGVIGVATIEYEMEHNEIIIFLISILATVFTTDLLKALVAHRLRRFVSFTLWKKISKVIGMALFLFGLRLIYFAITV
jgi:threonine/homoserine/homoserine lactone efflux protein